jgi:uncharacterized protein YjiS (DUF1127 family)
LVERIARRTAMMTTTYIAAGPHHLIALGSRVAGFLRMYRSALRARRERARARAILYGMQDRDLKDLGFVRSEIDSVMVDDSGERIRAYPRPFRRG